MFNFHIENHEPFGSRIKICVDQDKGIVSTCSGFLPGIFLGEGEFIVMQISFVMLIFLLFSHQISGGSL